MRLYALRTHVVAIAASELHRCTVEEVRGSSRRGGRKQANAALHLCTAPRCCAQPERTLYLPSFAQLQLLEIPSLTLRKRASELDCNVQQLQLLDRARVLPWLWSCIQRLKMLVSTSREQLPCGTRTRPVTVRSAPYRPRGAPWAVAKPELTNVPARSCQQLLTPPLTPNVNNFCGVSTFGVSHACCTVTTHLEASHQH